MKAILFALFFLAHNYAQAGDKLTDKSQVLKSLSVQLVKHYSKISKDESVKPKITLAGVQNTATSLTKTDVSTLEDYVEEGLSDITVVLDRTESSSIDTEQVFQQSGAVKDSDIQDLGNKYGANQLLFISLQDTVTPIDSQEENVLIVCKIKVIDVKTQRLLMSKTVEARYKHYTVQQSYFFRDSTSTLLGITGIVGTIAGFGYTVKGFADKDKYDSASDKDSAVKYRTKVEQDRVIVAASFVTALSAFGLQWYLDSKTRDTNNYHRYELTLLPTTSGRFATGGAFTWHF